MLAISESMRIDCGEFLNHTEQILLHFLKQLLIFPCSDKYQLTSNISKFGRSSAPNAIPLCFLQIFREARRVAPSIIYLPHVDSLWSTTTDTLKATFLSLVNDLPPNLPLLLFATCDLPISKIPPDLSMLFSLSCEQVRFLLGQLFYTGVVAAVVSILTHVTGVWLLQ